jgi:CDP-diacylglycerol--glycerol-3-phosphate 3-phosphatidyltransferase
MVLMIVAVALTVITGLDYVVQAVRPRVRTPHDGR